MTKEVKQIVERLWIAAQAECATCIGDAAQDLLDHLKARPELDKEPYEELDYSKYLNDDDTPFSRRQIKESRKQRMARVVNRNELRAEFIAMLERELGS